MQRYGAPGIAQAAAPRPTVSADKIAAAFFGGGASSSPATGRRGGLFPATGAGRGGAGPGPRGHDARLDDSSFSIQFNQAGRAYSILFSPAASTRTTMPAWMTQGTATAAPAPAPAHCIRRGDGRDGIEIRVP